MSGSDSSGPSVPADGCRTACCTAGSPVAAYPALEPDGVEQYPTELLARLRAAEERAEHLEQSLATARRIGVAVGLLAHRYDCSPEQAWNVLVRLSQATNVKVRELSRILCDAQAGRIPPPADIAAVQAVAAQLPRVAAGDERDRSTGTGRQPAATGRGGEDPRAAAGVA